MSASFYNKAPGDFAVAEGWFINDHGEIVRDDETAIFTDDDAALSHVQRLAVAGSALHRMALAATNRKEG